MKLTELFEAGTRIKSLKRTLYGIANKINNMSAQIPETFYRTLENVVHCEISICGSKAFFTFESDLKELGRAVANDDSGELQDLVNQLNQYFKFFPTCSLGWSNTVDIYPGNKFIFFLNEDCFNPHYKSESQLCDAVYEFEDFVKDIRQIGDVTYTELNFLPKTEGTDSLAFEACIHLSLYL